MPDDRPILRWAENGDRDDPGLSQELSGYAPLQAPPAGEFNYLMAQLGAKTHLFSTLSEADIHLPVGGIGMVSEYDPTRQFFSEIWGMGDASWTLVSSIALAGKYVYIAITAAPAVYRLDRETGEIVGSVTLGTMTVPTALAHDGVNLYVAGTVSSAIVVRAYLDDDITTPLWTSEALTGSSAVHDLYADGESVIAGHSEMTGGETVSLIDVSAASDGSAITWSLDPSGDASSNDIYAVLSDGVNIYAGGEEDSANKTLYRITYAGVVDGASVLFSNSGNGVIRDLCFGSDVGEVSDASVRGNLFIVADANSVDNSVALATVHPTVTNFISVWQFSLGAGVDATSCAWDGNLLYVGCEPTADDVTLVALCPATGSLVASQVVRNFAVGSVEHDGFALVAAGVRDTGDDHAVWRHYTEPSPSLVRKCDGTERYRWPMHLRLVRLDIRRKLMPA